MVAALKQGAHSRPAGSNQQMRRFFGGGGENRGCEKVVAVVTVSVGWDLAEFCSDMPALSRSMARRFLLLLSKFIMAE